MPFQRRKLNRLHWFDYSSPGYYFVTICVKNRKEDLGKIEADEMKLSAIGEIAKKQWLWLAKNFPYVGLDEWLIMPNHIHGIIELLENFDVKVGDGLDRTLTTGSVQAQPLQRLPLPKIIGAFKTLSSKFIRLDGIKNFQWQRTYYDHIIRDEKSLINMRYYIQNNIFNWEKDRNNVENLYI